VSEADKEDVDLAVDAAYEAYKIWRNISPYERSAKMNRLANLIERDIQILAELVKYIKNRKL
jgi:acyl-CoA reductase-like NAD-dependent aldehyde dehydrogenase